ncbi:two-component sensor protein histidine protein kinase [Aspergillus heteromorphus CBS 117.55]|uniref:histidine kinase n=1 Tax=Aspergillus heteromorphus CBS 117.55 TaxID=1448321 RepID=A0A317WBL5_9EURO|nr:two-component sensor protein histidine protein kinase [Aspergillus heteromorphus CBS 117.55]PWY83335.1 two-component sensor protein histidine protein kinase [Aspergillus heteromorphus CBS 117.55]
MAASFQHPEAERERIRDLSRYYCTVDRPAIRLEAATDALHAADAQADDAQADGDAETTTPPPGVDVRLSSDITLTALAQLAVFRFGCNRAFISLIDGARQYIIAEATKSVSLRDKDRHAPDDGIYLGVCTLDLVWGVCPHSISLFTGQDPSKVVDSPNVTANASRFIVRDFTTEDFFKDRPYVTGWPHFRFYAEVPLYSPAGHVLGSFCVIDDRPRARFGDDDVAALREVADAVAQHLEHVRIAHSHRRAESLVKGLTSFVKDHTAFDPLEVSAPVPTSAATQPVLDTLVRRDEPGPRDALLPLAMPLVPSPSAASELTGDLTSLFSAVTCSERTVTSTSVNAPASASPRVVVSDHTEFPAIAVMESEARAETLARIFTRASDTLRDSLDLEGVLFLDASRCNAGVVRPGQAGSWEPLPTTANPEFLADPYPSPIDLPGVGSLSNVSEKPCEVLGQPPQPGPGPPVTEALLDRMIAAFPQGQFLNLQDWVDDDQDDEDDENRSQASTAVPPEVEVETGNSVLRDICSQLRQHLPGAEGVLFYPLWDWNRSRWLAGTLVWTHARDRALEMEELHYFKVFGDSIISEVARIEWASTQKSKSDFISSVSHELRSPLHGILASAELLQTTPLQSSQAHWMNMVKSCGLTLLDTLNHLLDFAKINNLTTTEDTSPDPAKPSVTNLLTVFDLDDLIEEVTDVQYTGQRLARVVAPLAGRPAQPSPAAPADEALTVVVRVQERHAWKVQSVAGAWRRIVMNLLGNSLKWTKTGFIEVSLSKARRESNPHSVLAHLSVTDTGSGIAPDFLKHRLFSPFTQEDGLSEGLGLGFSIVRQLVSSLDGHIDVRSEVGVGTQVDIYIPVHAPPDLPRHPSRRSTEEIPAPSPPLAACLIGFDGYPTPRETPTGILPAEAKRKLAIRSSLTSVLAQQPGWTLALAETLDKAQGQVAVIEEDDLGTLRGQLPAVAGGFQFFLVLDRNRASHAHEPTPPNVVRVSQPFGPQKFQEALERPSQPSQPTSPTYFTATPLASPTSQTSSMAGLASPTDLASPLPACYPPCKAPKDIHVLLVDDNDINLKILATFVRKIGCSYDTASNGLIALNAYQAATRRHDIILMDISMPVMDGITATDQIRRYEKKNGLIPSRIIAVTGLGSAERQQQALAAGVDEYLVKPVSLHGLKKVMRIS